MIKSSFFISLLFHFLNARKNIFLLLAFLLIPNIALSANHYVRADAIGDGSGSDWTNAHSELPATLVRGDTYYIADGNYSSYTLDDATAGSIYIYIKKATVPDHGTNRGWDNSYGDGQAIFTPEFKPRTSYVIFDGVTGSGDDKTSYGFYIARTDCSGLSNSYLMSFGLDPLSNIQVSHVAFENCGSSYDLPQYSIKFSSYYGATTNLTISNNYFTNGSSNIYFRNWDNSTIENNYFDGNWSSSNNHGTQISPGNDSDDVIIRNNVFKNSMGTAVISLHVADNDRWKIYNNIIIGGSPSLGFGNGDSAYDDVVKSFEVHHNTFVNVKFLGLGAFFVGNLTTLDYKSYAYNNLSYNCKNPVFDNASYTSGAIVYGYSAHFDSTGTYDSDEGGTAQIGTGDPFVDIDNYNFYLKKGVVAIDAGKSDLGSLYEKAYNGISRKHGKAWDIGAYEFVGSPKNTTITK